MQETPKQYTKRILGYLKGREPLRVQQATPKRIEHLIRPLTRQQMRKRPAPRKWSIVEILAHLYEAVGGEAWPARLRLIHEAKRQFTGTLEAYTPGAKDGSWPTE